MSLFSIKEFVYTFSLFIVCKDLTGYSLEKVKGSSKTSIIFNKSIYIMIYEYVHRFNIYFVNRIINYMFIMNEKW